MCWSSSQWRSITWRSKRAGISPEGPHAATRKSRAAWAEKSAGSSSVVLDASDASARRSAKPTDPGSIATQASDPRQRKARSDARGDTGGELDNLGRGGQEARVASPARTAAALLAVTVVLALVVVF